MAANSGQRGEILARVTSLWPVPARERIQNRTRVSPGHTFRHTLQRLSASAALAIAILIAAGPGLAGELIRCPDWQRYVTPAAALRTTPPKRSFDAAMAESRAASAQAGQGVPTGTPGATCPTHTVRKGDTLGVIAIRTLGTSKRWHEIARANPGIDPNRLRVGTALTIPCRASGQTAPIAGNAPEAKAVAPNGPASPAKPTSPPKPTTCQYSVVAGDTLSKIAARQLGDVKRWPELARANALTAKSTLRIGQSLHLPCAPDGQGAAVTTSTPAQLPVWTARPGEFVSDVVDRWAKRAGHTVVRDGVEEWKIAVPVSISASFKDALDQLVVGFEGSGRPLAISLYANKVIRIGRPL